MTDREEWLAQKAKAVSSTEVSALFGMCPYLTAYELGVAKRDKQVIDVEGGERMRWGKLLQDSIAQSIADDFKVIVEGCEHEFMLHRDEPRMGSSFDYRIIGTEAHHDDAKDLSLLFYQLGPGLLEIKNVDWLIYKNWPENEAPDHIEIQLQHQMEVSGAQWAALGVLVGGNKREIYTRLRDERVGQSLLQKVRKFWVDMDKGVLPPAVLPQDADIIIRLHQYAEPGAVLDAQGNVTLASLCAEYVSAGDVAKKALEAQKSLKAQILSFIGQAERALVDGFRLTAAMRAPVEVKAHTRAGYRDCRITRIEAKKDG